MIRSIIRPNTSSFVRKPTGLYFWEGGDTLFDFSSIPDLGMCLLPGMGYTTVGTSNDRLEVWQSQFVNSKAEVYPATSMRPTLVTDSGTGLSVPQFDGKDDRMLLYESDGSNYSHPNTINSGEGTTFYLIRSDANQRMILFSDYDNNGYGLAADTGSSSSGLFSSYGTPSFRYNKTIAGYANRGDVWNGLFGNDDLRLSTEISVDISGWSAPQIGGYRNETNRTFMYKGLTFAFLHYKRELNLNEIQTVENKLEKLVGQLGQPV